MGEMTLFVKAVTDFSKFKKEVASVFKDVGKDDKGKSGGGLGDFLGLGKMMGAMTAKMAAIIGPMAIGIMFLIALVKGIMKAFDPILKIIELIGTQIGLMLRPFINLLIPLFVALSMGLRPVVKMFNMILRPVYKAMMTAMREAGGGMVGMGAAVGAGLMELSKLFVSLMGDAMKNNIMVMAELMITPFQLLVVALGQLFNMLLGAFGIDATKEIGGLVASLVGGMEMVKQGAIGIMSGLVDLTTSSIISGIENMYAPIAEEFANAGVEMETQLTPIQTLLSGLIGGLFGPEAQTDFEGYATAANNLKTALQEMVVNTDLDTGIEAVKEALSALGIDMDELTFEEDMFDESRAGFDAAMYNATQFFDTFGKIFSGDTEQAAEGLDELGGYLNGLDTTLSLVSNPVTALAKLLSGEVTDSFIKAQKNSKTAGEGINKTFEDLKRKWDNAISREKSRDTEGKAVGGVISKTDNYLLHEGEYVVPSGHARGNTENYNPTINIKGVVVNKDMDIRDLASKLERYMKQERRRSSSYA